MGHLTAAPIETVLEGKAPWRPKVAARIGFFLGPIAGALVVAASLRRMGLPDKAKKTVTYTVLLCIAFLIPWLLLVPEDAGINKLILVAIEGASYTVFPSILREDYLNWRTAHPSVPARNGWAAVGWGILGLLIYSGLGLLVTTAADIHRRLR